MAGDAKEMPSDLSEFCRVCLQLPQASQYLDLSTIYDEEDHLTYSDCFTICTQIDLKAGIGVPHHLCKSCGLELQMSYDFHKKVEESKRVIEKYEKKMQDGTNEQQLLYKPLPQKVVQKNQQQDTNEQELNDATTFFLSPMVVEGNNLPHSQKTLDLTQDEQEYLGSSDEENGVELLSKIGSIRDTVADDQENEHLVPMADCIEIEEHLEMEDFQNLETLEEEDLKTFVIKTERMESQDEAEEEIIIPDDTEMISNIKIENDYVCDREIKIENETLHANDMLMPLLKPGGTLPTSNGPPFICNICGHILRTKSALREHNIRKHRPNAKQYDKPYVCNNCGHYLPSTQMTQRTRSLRKCRDEITIFACNKCGVGKYEHAIRTETDSSQKVHICEYCLLEFKNVTNFREHVIQIHHVNPFPCHLCISTFKSSTNLKNHIQTKHENKRYVCEHPNCDKTYSTLDALRQHNYKHMNTMPYRCDICMKMFSREGKLRRHLQRDHDIQPSQQDLDDMLVGELISINAEIKTVNRYKKRKTI